MASLQQSASAPVVLIVEDEELVRRLDAETLAGEGFDVIEARDADEALALLRHRADVSVLFTDIGMGGTLDGLRLAHVVHDYWPEIGLILASGLARPTAAELPEGALFLGKPYSFEMMTLCVRDLAARRPNAQRA